jgi:hypothetical protein
MKIFNREDNSFFGYLKNITEEGIMTVSGSEKEVNKTHPIRMILPKTISGTDELIVQAKCLWTRKDIDSDNFLTGFRLIDITAQEKEIITLLIEYFGLK